jgi:hypothetical protein
MWPIVSDFPLRLIASVAATTRPTASQRHVTSFPCRSAGLYVIMKSVFRLAARRTVLSVGAPQLGAAPVSEKRIGLNRSR